MPLETENGLKGWYWLLLFFEHFGSQILERHTNGGIKNSELNLDLKRILRLLYDFQLVDESTHSKMNEIRKERNRMVHDPFRRIDENRIKRLIEDAIECLRKLGVRSVSYTHLTLPPN